MTRCRLQASAPNLNDFFFVSIKSLGPKIKHRMVTIGTDLVTAIGSW